MERRKGIRNVLSPFVPVVAPSVLPLSILLLEIVSPFGLCFQFGIALGDLVLEDAAGVRRHVAPVVRPRAGSAGRRGRRGTAVGIVLWEKNFFSLCFWLFSFAKRKERRKEQTRGGE